MAGIDLALQPSFQCMEISADHIFDHLYGSFRTPIAWALFHGTESGDHLHKLLISDGLTSAPNLNQGPFDGGSNGELLVMIVHQFGDAGISEEIRKSIDD